MDADFDAILQCDGVLVRDHAVMFSVRDFLRQQVDLASRRSESIGVVPLWAARARPWYLCGFAWSFHSLCTVYVQQIALALKRELQS